jgi:dTDP-4-amino-4,6-dideoxygalactose transaminase
MRRLAIRGGTPAFEAPLHVGRPNIGDREIFFAHARRMFDNRWLTNFGPIGEEFERELCRFLGVRHCIPVCNATIGLELAIRALGMKGEVILPAFTFIATAHALQWQGITPVFADIDPVTHNLDPSSVERLITPRTTGIIGVHLWGRACPVEELQTLADRHGLKLLFDAAHAFGCAHKGKRIGGFGDAEVFSFHATKFFNTFEGGAIATDSDELAGRLRLMINFGFTGYDRVEHIGTNGKMSEASAAMGLANLASLDEFRAANRRNYAAYHRALAGIHGLHLLPYEPAESSNHQYVIVEVDSSSAGVDRDTILRILHAENVLARRYFWPGCHLQEPYRTLYPDAGKNLPQTGTVAERVLALPTGTAVSDGDIEIIGSILREVVPACQMALEKGGT